ncbi:hypothetical protein Hypma_014609 [Hypsizygus marmoreus]|uniref:Uncharacterized protein n=1 Tax=Hypsizygus marmoreus TaxID=39966 RepID=A0A369JA66_HYPMA|nr:hypothetical protein Hypma_014609 [Hypsizygus marmoreus]
MSALLSPFNSSRTSYAHRYSPSLRIRRHSFRLCGLSSSPSGTELEERCEISMRIPASAVVTRRMTWLEDSSTRSRLCTTRPNFNTPATTTSAPPTPLATSASSPTNTNLNVSTHWCKFASDILTGSWDPPLEELNTVRDAIDATSLLISSSPALVQLHSRT